MTAVDWYPDWRGSVCAVVASGESATPEALEKLKGRCRVIVVNNSFRLAPWADVLYAADSQWWDCHRDAYAFGGLKITSHATWAKRFGLKFVEVELVHAFKFERTSVLPHMGNSGARAINLAIQFGVKRILGIGLDFRGGHWHGPHPLPLNNPMPQRLETWRGRLDAQAPLLAKNGIEFVVCSDKSALTAYRKDDVERTLERWAAA